jgi:ATP-dependent DNA helicase RecQ
MNPPEKALLPLPTSDQKARAEAKPASTPSFPAGATVKVPKAGKGQVLSSTDEMVTIIFPDSQKRTFLKNHVELL